MVRNPIKYGQPPGHISISPFNLLFVFAVRVSGIFLLYYWKNHRGTGLTSDPGRIQKNEKNPAKLYLTRSHRDLNFLAVPLFTTGCERAYISPVSPRVSEPKSSDLLQGINKLYLRNRFQQRIKKDPDR